ncbi:MAG: 4-hydroxythreonine-4-phosphate dehydrogenase [Bacteriovoracaceae bacterium]|nr:4-hydroxythreonine-4-phosphate dehydrogenase [Bacteriovoracaceae bacterium]
MIEIAATLGDPTSIGPEVGIKSIRAFSRKYPDVNIHLFAPRSIVSRLRSKNLFIHDPEIKSVIYRAGKPSKISAARALRDLERATDFCIAKPSRVLVTGPLDKFLCSKADPSFRGHTEYLRDRAKASGTTMLLAGKKLKVALVTTHLPLKEVSKRLTSKEIIDTTVRTHHYFSRFVRKPRIAVLGLNPHASDHGLFGDEEKKIIKPAISRLKTLKINVEGPFSPDSFFHQASGFDAVICMYHDQGLIPLKMLHFYDAVNITLGLSFLRTSVDHGTAFDIAGKRKASNLSYTHALHTAYHFAKTSRDH